MNLDSIEQLIYYNPKALLSIKSYKIIQSINDYLPYSVGIEIECNKLTNFNIDNFHNIENIMEVSCDNSEQRFRIPNNINGLICLYEISKQLKLNSELNLGSGIHYHIDMTDCFDLLTSEIIERNSEFILKELDTWNYNGTFNNRLCNLNISHNWIRFQDSFKTAEIRIGEMTFDYNLLIKRIIHSCKIVKKLKEDILTNEEQRKLIRLKRELENFNIKNKVNSLENIDYNELIKQRQRKI